ncbi:hypothetical protein [Streptomyces sp. NPDC127112]|uniref:hypothetical protein n=1 Tax=Streptomyces sp. NPDC127112 TaxID=3345364 RepID=UPI003628D841
MEEDLRRFQPEKSIAAEAELEREELPPVQRLLGVFAPVGGDTALIPGCPFHNAVPWPRPPKPE